MPIITYFNYVILILKHKNIIVLYYVLNEETLIDLIKKTRIRISYDYNQLLTIAIKKRKMLLLKFILANKRFKHKKGHISKNLMIAINYNNIEALHILLEDGRLDPLYNYSEALRYACDGGKIEMTKLLLADGRSDVTARNQSPLRWATVNGHFNIVEMLMEFPEVNPTFRINPSNRSAFTSAYIRGYTKILKLFLDDPRVDPTIDDNHMLKSICKYGYLDIIKMVKEHPLINFSVSNNILIFTAATNNHTDIAKFLIVDKNVLRKLDAKGIKYLYMKGIMPKYGARVIEM